MLCGKWDENRGWTEDGNERVCMFLQNSAYRLQGVSTGNRGGCYSKDGFTGRKVSAG